MYVAADLVGLAIGREGNNVNEVRKLDGILSVEFEDDQQMFRIKAKVRSSTTDYSQKRSRIGEILR